MIQEPRISTDRRDELVAELARRYTVRFTCRACGFTTDDALSIEVIDTMTEHCPECSAEIAPGMISGLPTGWETTHTTVLEAILADEHAEPFLIDPDYDRVIEELESRYDGADPGEEHHLDHLPPS
jgi:rRNA maturation protein Nop10